jgi:hypothetical protein
MGLTPHRAAKEAWLLMRSGLSPAVMSSAAALSGPMRVVAAVGVGVEHGGDVLLQLPFLDREPLDACG